jgi:hypothetical protein
MILKTPSQQTFKINISPFTDPSGSFVVIFEDITERRRWKSSRTGPEARQQEQADGRHFP